MNTPRNQFDVIPLEIRYKILDMLKPTEAEKTAAAIEIDTDDSYWHRRHKRDFAGAISEIAAISYLIEERVRGSIRGLISTMTVGDYTTKYILLDHHSSSPRVHITQKLTAESNKTAPKLQHAPHTRGRHWIQQLDCGFAIHRSICTKYFAHVNTISILRTTIMENFVRMTRWN